MSSATERILTLFSYVFVTQDFSQRNLTYFSYTQTLCLTFFGIVAGIIMATTRRYKWMLVAGLLIRLLGCGLMLHARGPNGNVASLVMCQVLQGAGGGFAATSILVGPQAVVRHADVATVIAMVLLITEVGNSVGSAAATGLWQQHMPKELATYVPTNNGTLLTEIFGDITIIKAMPITDPIRMGAITAYQHMMHKLVLGAVVVAVFPPIFAVFLMKDIRLSDAQNAHDGKDTAGNTIEEPEQSYRSEKEEALKERRQSFV